MKEQKSRAIKRMERKSKWKMENVKKPICIEYNSKHANK